MGKVFPSFPGTEHLPPGRFLFRIYDTKDGLANLSVWTLAQDRTGFIWAGTEDGLFRYDVGMTAPGTSLPGEYLARLRAEAESFLKEEWFRVETSLGDPQRVRWS